MVYNSPNKHFPSSSLIFRVLGSFSMGRGFWWEWLWHVNASRFFQIMKTAQVCHTRQTVNELREATSVFSSDRRWEEVVLSPSTDTSHGSWVLETLFNWLTFIENLFWAHHGTKLHGPTTQTRLWGSCTSQLCSECVSTGAVKSLLTLNTMCLAQRWTSKALINENFLLWSFAAQNPKNLKSLISMPGH